MKYSIFFLFVVLVLVNAYKGQFYNKPNRDEKGGGYRYRIAARILKCNKQDDLTRVNGRCNQYKTCENGILKYWTCPKNYLFDSMMKACSPKHLNPNVCSNQF